MNSKPTFIFLALVFVSIAAWCDVISTSVSVENSPPMPGPVPVRRQSFLRSVFKPKPVVATNILTVNWDDVPGAIGYNVYFSTRDGFFEIGDVVSEINSSATFAFTNAWGQRPVRWFFAVSAFNSERESELSFCHWPPYPKILDGFQISWSNWNGDGFVFIESCVNYFSPYTVTNMGEVELVYPKWELLGPFLGPSTVVPLESGSHFFRDSMGVLNLKIEPVFKPDPRDE